MTLNLKLVRHQDGKWTALPPETDDLTQVSDTEKKSAPIDPAQLLKALDSLLSPDGGIRSIEDVPRLASLMKKFSKKLVSRCVYCNVLQATKSEILSEYLDKGGWETINTWLQYAKSSGADSFLLEMLKLCKLLPMTLNRLKENNTAKLIKSLTKHENKEVKSLSTELVNHWMSIIKDKKASEISEERKKKKLKSAKVEPVKDDVKVKAEVKTSPKHVPESPKGVTKLKGIKRTADKEKKVEIYEDVKIDPEPLLPIPKKPRPDRPKTAKIYQKKFRATGLEEETPLPKNINKKSAVVDKTVVAAAKSAFKHPPSSERITEKKIKPESLMAINDSPNSKGIKLIPAKPRPTYVLHESASFMDALISQPVVPVKRKKKTPPKSSPTTSGSPTSPTLTPPKFQFYKDTLEMNEEVKKEETEKSDAVAENETSSETADAANVEENVPMDTTEEGGHTPPNDEENAAVSPSDLDIEEYHQKTPVDPNHLRSILSHGRRKSKKKSVKWVEDNQLKTIFYFDLDETERVNVSRNQGSFYDLKSIEMKRERETMEMAKRQAGDRVEEFRRWWIPSLMDLPPALVDPGCNSNEKINEVMRQQGTLQEIYFTREMIPDSPHEPDLEIVAPKEARIIPLDEDNLISPITDYSNFKITTPVLPEILTSLMKLNANLSTPQAQIIEPVQMPIESQPPQKLVLIPEPAIPQHIPMPLSQPYEPGPDPPLGSTNGLLGHAPPSFNPPIEVPHMELQGEWRTPQDLSPTDSYYLGYSPNQNMPLNQHPGGNVRPPPPLPPQVNIRGNFRGLPPRGGPPMGVRPHRRKVCRHFTAGLCRFGMNCAFLHPGVNCPL